MTCTGHDFELGRTRSCRYTMGTLRRTTSFDWSLRLWRHFDAWELWGLLYHRCWRKVDGDLGWRFFDTSEHDVRELDDAPSNFLVNVGGAAYIEA